MSILTRFRRNKSKEEQWDVVTWPWGGWNYPEPIMTDDEWAPRDRQPADPYLKHLAYMAGHGWYYFQKAFVEMQAIHPLASYKPIIDDEFRETFDAVHDKHGMPLLLYERKGKLIMGNDWEAYWLYREREDPSVPCIILGHFDQSNSCVAVCDKPYMMKRPEYLFKPQHPLTNW